MKTEYIYSLIVIVLISVSCGQRQDNDNNQRPFPQVSVPSMMTDSREAAGFLSEHFWDEFTDTSGLYPCDSVLVNGVTRADLEQAYVNWLSVLDMVPYEEATASVQRLFDRISAVERKDTASSVRSEFPVQERGFLSAFRKKPFAESLRAGRNEAGL